MSDDEKTNEEVLENESQETESKIETLEDALKELAKVRREAAAKRTKNKALEEDAQKWKEHLDSQKTELEKLADRVRESEERSKQLLRDKIIAEYGLKPEFADFVVGDTEEELKSKAEKLSTLNSSKEEEKPDFFAGQRGERVAPVADDLNSWFTNLWKEVDSTKQRF